MRLSVLLSIVFVVFSTPPMSANEKITRKTKLTEKTYPAIVKALRKLPVKTYWQTIPWHPNLGDAIKVARKHDKPVLLWAMNGHPCGMT